MSTENIKDTIEVDVFTLELENKKQDFAILDMFEYEENTYIVVAEISDDIEIITDDIIDEGNIEIFGYDAENSVVESIDDDAEYEKIAKFYEALCEEESEEFELDIITLTMDDDKDHEFAIMDQFEYENKEYIVLSELDGDVIYDDMLIYEYNSADDTVTYIEDDEEYNKIANFYAEMCGEDEVEITQ